MFVMNGVLMAVLFIMIMSAVVSMEMVSMFTLMRVGVVVIVPVIMITRVALMMSVPMVTLMRVNMSMIMLLLVPAAAAVGMIMPASVRRSVPVDEVEGTEKNHAYP